MTDTEKLDLILANQEILKQKLDTIYTTQDDLARYGIKIKPRIPFGPG